MISSRFFLALMASFSVALADVKLPPIFSEHAVLEKTAKVPVWGKAEAGEMVTVKLDTQTQSATAGQDGRWRVDLDLSQSAQGPFTMIVSGKNTIEIPDVVVGEVWLASGQSNMEWKLKDSMMAETEIPASANPLLREFRVTRAAKADPTEDFEGAWYVAGPSTAGDFSGVGYFFGQRLQQELKAPVGILYSVWGGTPVESWTSMEAMSTVPVLAASSRSMRKVVGEAPGLRARYISDFKEWLVRTNRGDRPTADVAAFVHGDTSTGWTTVNLPGELSSPDLPANGAIWLRRVVDTDSANAGLPFAIGLGPLEGFETVYWNGERIWQVTYENYLGKGYYRWLYLGPDKMKPGKNELAIRVYCPSGKINFPMAPRVSSLSLDGAWQARAEFALPPKFTGKPAPEAPPAPPREEDTAAYLFNGMINPLIPYAIKGAIWYQGESNAPRAFQYRQSFPLMIGSWRSAWGQGDFPFYFCQLANFQVKYPNPAESTWAELRESQVAALALPKTGQAILIDIGESENIHPRNKKDVGERLARLALANDYGIALPAVAPVYQALQINGDQAVLSFDLKGGKLVARPVPETYDVATLNNLKSPLVRNSPGSELEGFAICGADHQWVWADARIDGDKVIVSSPSVKAPVAVRYAWADNPTCNLYSEAGLPVSPFRTDDFPATTKDVRY